MSLSKYELQPKLPEESILQNKEVMPEDEGNVSDAGDENVQIGEQHKGYKVDVSKNKNRSCKDLCQCNHCLEEELKIQSIDEVLNFRTKKVESFLSKEHIYSAENYKKAHEFLISPVIQDSRIWCYGHLKKEYLKINPAYFAKVRELKDPIIVDRSKDEFFIAVAKKNGHSFVFLGIVKEEKPILLARVGKLFKLNKDKEILGKDGVPTDPTYIDKIKKLLASENARFYSEPLQLRGNVSYMAYNISYNQYLEFMKLISLDFQKKQTITCYQAKFNINDNHVILNNEDLNKGSAQKEEQNTVHDERIVFVRKKIEYSSNIHPTESQQKIIARSHRITLWNTCRHTAIDLMENILKSRLPNFVSRLFLCDLPLKAEFISGEPKSHFFVLPFPPSAYQVSNDKMPILIEIYQRMENLLRIDPNSEITMNKFKALKALYLTQAQSLKCNSITTALDSLYQWKQEYGNIISQLRDQSIFGKLVSQFIKYKSSTQSMVDKVEEELNALKKLS